MFTELGKTSIRIKQNPIIFVRHFSFLSDQNFQTVGQLFSNNSEDFVKTDVGLSRTYWCSDKQSHFALPTWPIQIIALYGDILHVHTKSYWHVPKTHSGIFLPFRTWGGGPLTLGKNCVKIYQIESLKQYVNILAFLLPAHCSTIYFFIFHCKPYLLQLNRRKNRIHW